MQHPLIVGALCALVFTLDLEGQNAIVVPDLGTAGVANSSSAYPWNRRNSAIRVQYIYDTTHFTAAANPVSIPILIQRLRFRGYDTAGTTVAWTGGIYGAVTIRMSSAAVDYTAMTTTFASNHGTDLATVYSGAATVTPGTGTGSGVPGLYYVDVTLTTPFLYDPTTGNDLLLDFAIPAAMWTPTTGTATSNALASGTQYKTARMYNLTSDTAATGSLQNNSGLVTEINYVPASGLYASFTATPTSGGPNLTVKFTDTSYSSDPGGVKTWAWDFDGDNQVDSTLQNPSFVFKCGTYSPKLTVTDAANPPSSKTETNMIEAGLVTADFSANMTFGNAPMQVTFTDSSTGGPVAWEWDFGDGSPKSTAQNPVHVYTKGGKFTVTLKSIGLCNNDSEIKTGLVEVCAAGGNSGSMTTTFADNNGLSAAGCGNLFDLTVLNPDGLKFTAIDINTSTAALTTATIDVYVSPFTYVGNDNNQHLWTKVSTGTGVSAGRGNPTSIDVDDFYLAPGSYGVFISFITGGVAYTNGIAGPGGNLTFKNCDLQFDGGYGKNTPWTGSRNTPRIFNGTFYYSANDQAASGGYGYGCPGSNTLVPSLALSAVPKVGTNVTINVGNMINVPSGTAILLIGTKSAPFDLGVMGMPNCALVTSPLMTVGFTNTAGSASLPASIPNNASLIGAQVFAQAANTDATANAAGLAATHGLGMRIGN